MLLKLSTSAVVAAALLGSSHAAIVSLYIPGADPSLHIPYTADNIGTDGQGHTSWRLASGIPSGIYTATPTDKGNPGAQFTATLVEGPDYANIFGVDPNIGTLGAGCSIKNGIADCTLSFEALGRQTSIPVGTQAVELVDIQTSSQGAVRTSSAYWVVTAMTLLTAIYRM